MDIITIVKVKMLNRYYLYIYIYIYIYIYMSQELRSLLRDLIPEPILSQKRHTHRGPIGNGSGVMSF